MAATTNMQKQKNPATQSAETRVTRPMRKFAPAVDIFERSDELVIVADVPGATADNIDIQFEKGSLSIEACVKPRGEDRQSYLACEYGVGNFRRTFEVNEQIDADKISAKVENGVLTITLPKVAKIQPRKVTVKSE